MSPKYLVCNECEASIFTVDVAEDGCCEGMRCASCGTRTIMTADRRVVYPVRMVERRRHQPRPGQNGVTVIPHLGRVE